MDKPKSAPQDEAKDQIEPDVENAAKPTSKNREVYWLVGVILVIALIFLAYKLGKQSSVPSQTLPMPSLNTQASSTPNTDSMENWKMYKNKTHVIIFQYPGDWYIIEDSESQNGFSIGLDTRPNKDHGPGYMPPISIGTNNCSNSETNVSYPCDKSIDDSFQKLKPDLEETTITIKQITVDNVVGKQLRGVYKKFAGPFAGKFIKITEFQLNSGYLLSIITDDDQLEPIYDQILSTFKFIDSPKTDTSQVIIYSPASNSLISSPVTVTGKIPSLWVFEATFPVRILDSNRNELALKAADTQGDWTTDTAVEFSVTIDYQTTDKTGFIEISNDNPSGLPENSKSYEIPIRFQ